MSTKTKKEVNPDILEKSYQIYLEQVKIITSCQEWINFNNSHSNLHNAFKNRFNNIDFKLNSVLWAYDVSRLCRQIAFSYCWMNSYAEVYKKEFDKGDHPTHTDFQVSYFAENCITRIDSCRDKLALMVWAFYCPFNPEKKNEIPDYQEIVKRLKNPKKFGHKFKNQNHFLKYLDILEGNEFSIIEKYRHLKIHRREPRIEIYGVESYHDIDYIMAITDKNDIKKWEEELEKNYSVQHYKESHIIDGVLYDRKRLKDHLWNFEEVKKHIRSCLFDLLKASDGLFSDTSQKRPIEAEESIKTVAQTFLSVAV